jgi:hypothetical protein
VVRLGLLEKLVLLERLGLEVILVPLGKLVLLVRLEQRVILE